MNKFSFGVGFYPDHQFLAERRHDNIIMAALCAVGAATVLANVVFAITMMVMP